MILASFWRQFGSTEEAVAFFFTLARIFFICTSITLGFYCMILMKKKGYNTPALWFLLGFFLSFIGLIICLLKKEIHYTTIMYQQPYDQYCSQPPVSQSRSRLKVLNANNAVRKAHRVQSTAKCAVS